MKKNVWAKLVSLMLVLVCIAGLAACKGGSSESKLLGKYSLKTIEMAGVSVDVENAESLLGSSFAMDLELKKDGKCSVSMTTGDQTESSEGTWTEDGDKFTLVMEGDELPGTVEDGNLVLDFGSVYEGMTMVLEKK